MPWITTVLIWISLAIPAAAEQKLDAAAARDFVKAAEAEARATATESSRLGWIQATYIIDDTNVLLAAHREKTQAQSLARARGAARFDGVEVDANDRRKLNFMKQRFSVPPPSDPELSARLAQLRTELPAEYSAFKYCRSEGDCLDFEAMGQIMANSRNPQELEEIWTAWRNVSPPYRGRYAELVGLANVGAKELGAADAGVFDRMGYDMEPGAFSEELGRVVRQVKPLYEALHCHVRARLNETYGDDVAPKEGPIPAHLLGNMWAQEWNNIYPLMDMADNGSAIDVTQIIVDQGLSEVDMARVAERFFTSMGLAPLPETYWTRSLFTRPRDRDVVCHASAWHIDADQDVRLKMCIQRTEEDFRTLHHELGHNFYQLAYSHQDYLFQDSANDAFHEAVGDTLALSVGPKYLTQLGYLDKEPPADNDLPLLMKSALEKIPLLAWGYLVDQWRWGVASGDIAPDRYNAGWWELRERIQGLEPPSSRDESHFDAGSKYHVAASVSYTRYFLARVLQFQFHRALCEAAGQTGPLHRCSIYGSRAAGDKLKAMMAMGASQPWPDALEALTGTRELDATAIQDYFAPLMAHLEKENVNRQCGW